MEKGARVRPPYLLKHRCNSQAEIDAALAEGFAGVEVDLVWNSQGDIILSHSHAKDDGPALDAIDFHGCIVAVNIKEYGMSACLGEYFVHGSSRDWFVFDVPGPELDIYCMAGVRVFGRYSQWEDQCRMVAVPGTLIDDFTGTPEGQLKLYLSKVRPMALISNELRGGDDSVFVLRNVDYVIRKTLP